MSQNNDKRVLYLSIDGVLNKRIETEEEFINAVKNYDNTFDEFKLSGLTSEELLSSINTKNVTINFLLNGDFGRDMLNFIFKLNGITINNLDYYIKKVLCGDKYYYTIRIVNDKSHLYAHYDLKHDFDKTLPPIYCKYAFNDYSINSINKLLEDIDEIALSTSLYNEEFIVDMLKYHGVKIKDKKIRKILHPDTDKGISIAFDILDNNINNYIIVDSVQSKTYTMFKDKFINTNKKTGLTNEDIKPYLENVKKKEMIKNGRN